MKRLWENYRCNENGNFAIMFSVVISLLVLAVAVVIETTRMQGAHRVLQDMADSAALSGAYIAKTDIQGREQSVRENIRFHQAYIPDLGLATNAKVKFDDDKEEVRVTIPRELPTFFGGILKRKSHKVLVESTVSYKSEAIDPISISFALDVSGSMGFNTDTGAVKLDVLKQSTKILFTELEDASPRPDLLRETVRTGMSAYNLDVVSKEEMGWGWTHLENSVDNLIAEGATNSAPALKNAYEQLKYDRIFRKSHDPKFNIDILREYVVFMTDGDNNKPDWDQESAEICQEMQADGIEIYSIAFTAPEKGQLLLLDCASWNNGAAPEDYDDDDDGKKSKKKNKCLGNGSKGKGKALGHCKKKENKSKYFFDADDAKAFKAAFSAIGTEIAQNTIRIKS